MRYSHCPDCSSLMVTTWEERVLGTLWSTIVCSRCPGSWKVRGERVERLTAGDPLTDAQSVRPAAITTR